MSTHFKAQIRAILNDCARNRQTISYRDLAHRAAIPAPLRRLTDLLEEITHEDHATGHWPTAVGLVVSQSPPTIPRAGFFRQLQKIDAPHPTGPTAEQFHGAMVREIWDKAERGGKLGHL